MFAMIDWWPRKSKRRLERDIANEEFAKDGHNDTQNGWWLIMFDEDSTAHLFAAIIQIVDWNYLIF